MSTKTIDSRVVEMRFDNKQFERGAKESLSTLEKLKKALNMSSSAKEFDKINAAVKKTSMDSIMESVQKLEKRFSVMGIVGMQTVQNLTNAMESKLVRGIAFVNDAIVEGGKKRAFNIENAHFQLQALLKDEEKVQAVMKNANDSVTGTAYAYDEAAKAASMFAASGLQAGKEMEEALMGVVGVAAMTNSEYESIANIFTTVAGNGRLMGDQLLQLSSRGLNAAATLADYFNGVNKGAIKASEDVKASIMNLTSGLQVTEGDIREFVSDGEISFRMFAAAMNDAFGESAKKANETFTGAFANMKSALGRIGAEFYSPLIEQNSEVVLLLNALKDRINEVKKGLTFDKEIGNTNALSKQFTDAVLAMAKSTREFVTNVDLQTPLKIFYHGVESIKNLGKGLFMVLSPLGKAIQEVFGSSVNPANLEKLSASLEKFTSKLKMSKKTSNNLKDAFSGVLSVAKLLMTAFTKLVGAIVPFGSSANYLGGSFTELLGVIGRFLTKASEWISQSKAFNVTFEVLGDFVDGLVIGFGLLAKVIVEVGRQIRQIPLVDKVFEKVKDIFSYLEKKSPKTMDENTSSIQKFTKALEEMVPKKIDEAFQALADASERVHDIFAQMDFSTPKAALNALKESVVGLLNVFKNSDGVGTFVKNMKQYMETLKESFKLDKLSDNIEKFRSKVGGFIEWLHDIIGPMVKELNFGTFIAAGTGVGIVAGILKLSKAVKSMSETVSKFGDIPKAFSSLRSALEAYEKDLNASAIIKVAGAIAILAGAITVMSFADPQRLANAAIALTVVSATLLGGVTAFASVMNKTRSVADVANTAVTKLGKVLDNLTKAIKWNAIAKAIKNFIVGIGVIAASIAGIAYMYSKDADAIKEAINIIKLIGKSLLGAVGILMVLAQVLPKGAKAIGSAAPGILAFSVSLGIVVLSLTKLMEIELPKDWKTKFKILAGIFASLAGVLVALGIASKISGKGKVQASILLALIPLLTASVSSLKGLFKIELPKDWKAKLGILAGIFLALDSVIIAVGGAARLAGDGKIQSAPLLALATVLTASVSNLKKLFNMDLPEDWKLKCGIMAGMFAALAGVMIAVGAAAKMSKGGLKAGPTILAIATFIGAATTALMVLQAVPWDGLKKGAASLSIVLLALAAALYGAGQIKTEAAGKAVQAMVQVVGVISGSLAVLALIPWEQLRNAALVLGGLLAALAGDLYAASKIGNDKTWASVAAMVGIVISIAGSLKALAGIPWEELLSATGAMSATLLSMAGAFKIIGSSKPDLEKIGMFLVASSSVLLIAMSLKQLAGQPWDGLMAAGTAISETLLAFSAAFLIISKSKPNLKAMGAFLAGSASMILIAGSIAILANNPWTSLLAAGHAISEVMLAMSAAMAVCALVGNAAAPAIAGIGLLDLLIVDITAVFAALGYLFKSNDAQALLNGGIETLVKIADGIARVVDALVGGTLEKLSARLPKIGKNITTFMKNLEGFFEGAKRIDANMLTGVENLTKTMAILTGTSLADSIIKFVSGGKSTLVEFGKELAKFGPYLSSFADSVKDVDGEAVESVSRAIGVMTMVADSLPRNDSIAEVLFGEKATLSEFGKELASFGPHLKEFTDSVKDINPESVEAAANAANVLAEMAKNLPNSGGFAAKVFGDNSLEEFGLELESFGPHLKEFAKSVKDINPETVEAAANAASVMSKVEKNLPNSGGFAAKVFGDNKLSDFGAELEAFGPHLKSFTDSVKDISSETVEAAGNATIILGNAAKNLPRSNWLAEKIFGDRKLSDFGAELEAFGPHFKSYADSVKDVDSSSVESAANATKIMASIANDLPNSEGLASKILGDNKLSDFGAELEAFGPHLKSFSESVGGIDAEGVESAANSIKILAQVADILPNSDGLAAVIFGDNKLSDFGAELEAFGPHLASFSESVKNVTPESVEAAANSMDILAKVADTFPEPGFMDKILGNDNMNRFGVGLEKIGVALRSFYEYTSTIDVGYLNEIINEVEHLSKISSELVNVDTEGMNNFASALENMGRNGIDAFINGFKDCSKRVQDAVDTMFQYVNKALERGKTTVQSGSNDVGKNIAQSLATGINTQQTVTVSAVQTLSNSVMEKLKSILTAEAFRSIAIAASSGLQTGINSKKNDLVNAIHTLGQALVQTMQTEFAPQKLSNIGMSGMAGFAQGLTSQEYIISNATARLSSNVISTMSRNLDQYSFRNIGSNAALGLAYGIEDRIWDIADAAIRAAQQAINSAQRTLQTHSPSKVFFNIGKNVDEGLANGILNYARLVAQASEEMSEEAIDGSDDILAGLSRISTSISDSEDMNPVITPTMDLSQVQKDYNTLLALMNQGIASTYGMASGIGVGVMDPRKAQTMETTSAIQGLSASLSKADKTGNIVYNNVFEIHGEDPETIAEEVSVILQKQVERREAVWGM